MKKKLSRLLCALLVMTMVLAMVPAVSAATVSTKYVGDTITVTKPCRNAKHTLRYEPTAASAKYLKQDTTDKNEFEVISAEPGETTEIKIVAKCDEENIRKEYTYKIAYRAVTSVTLNKKTLTIGADYDESKAAVNRDDYLLQATIKPEKAYSGLIWISLQEDVVSVNATTGALTAHSEGKATIRVMSSMDNSKKAECVVTVTKSSLLLELAKEEMNLKVGDESSVKATISGPDYTDSCYVDWKAYDTLTEAEAHSGTSSKKVEFTGDSKGTFTAKKVGPVYLSAVAKKPGSSVTSEAAVCVVYIKDDSYEVKIKPVQIGVYDPEDEDDKFRTAEKYEDKDRLQLDAYVTSETYTAEAPIVADWSVDNADVVAFENTDESIRKDTVAKVTDAKSVVIRAMGTGKTTVTAKTSNGTATFTIEVWDTTYILEPSKTAYDYTSVVTVSTDNPLASMQTKVPTHPVTEVSVKTVKSGKKLVTTVTTLGNIPVPVEWTSRTIDEKNKNATFTGVLKLEKNEKYSEYVVVDETTGKKIDADVTVKAIAKISDSASSIKIKTQPKSETYNVGKTISALKVVATGSSNLSYQWYDATETNKAISGATKATYTPEITKSGTYKYYCIVSAGGEYVVSETATIKVSGEYRVVLSNSSDKTVSTPSANVGSATTYGVDVEKWDYSTGKYGSAGSCTISWAVTKNSEYGTVSSTSSSVTFTGKLAKAATKGFETMTVTATIKKSGTEVSTDEIEVTINPAEAATVKQSVGSGAALKSSSITSAVTRAAGSGAKISYVVFGSPKGCTLTKSSSSSTSIGDTKCYVSTTSGQKLSDVYVKTTASSASVTYTAYDADDYALASGTVSFDANDSNDTISSSGASFKNAAAVDQIIEEYPEAEYVKLDLPRASEGKLYYDFNTISDFASEVKDSDKYYVNASSSQADVEDVYFLPVYGVKGKITIDYTAYGSNNSDLGTGKITLSVKSKTASSKFTDVTASNVGSWAADSIDFCADNDLVNGKSTYSFAPKDNLTRGQLVAILYRAAGSPSVTGTTNPFNDVKTGDYYYNAVLWAYKNDVVNGTGAGKFSPNANVTREQIAAILYRYMGSPAATGSLSGYTDRSKISSWATTAMQWAIGKGYITGTSSTTLDPLGQATRAQAAVMLHRFLTK